MSFSNEAKHLVIKSIWQEPEFLEIAISTVYNNSHFIFWPAVLISGPSCSFALILPFSDSFSAFSAFIIQKRMKFELDLGLKGYNFNLLFASFNFPFSATTKNLNSNPGGLSCSSGLIALFWQFWLRMSAGRPISPDWISFPTFCIQQNSETLPDAKRKSYPMVIYRCIISY